MLKLIIMGGYFKWDNKKDMSKNGELLIYRGKNLPKRARDLYSTNSEMLTKETADNTDGERDHV